jgi:DNA-directed RNA polymerase sigma subunit (sigma70/sigma32)
VTVDQPISQTSDLTWADILQDETAEPAREVQRDAVRREIERALAVLEPRQEWAIRARFGFLPALCLPLEVRESGDVTLDERLDGLERAVARTMKKAPNGDPGGPAIEANHQAIRDSRAGPQFPPQGAFSVPGGMISHS